MFTPAASAAEAVTVGAGGPAESGAVALGLPIGGALLDAAAAGAWEWVTAGTTR